MRLSPDFHPLAVTMLSAGDGHQLVPVAVLHDGAGAPPASLQQRLLPLGVGQRVPVEGDDAEVVVAAAKKSCCGIVDLRDQ